jgi:hypothetical protein
MAIENFCAFAGDCLLSDVMPRQIEGYRLEPLKSVKPVTVHIELRALRAAFGVAVRWRQLESNPLKGLVLARGDEVKPGYFSKSDLQSLLVMIKENWLRELVAFAVPLGRTGERCLVCFGRMWASLAKRPLSRVARDLEQRPANSTPFR